jgi:hypothetical protein
MKVVILLLYLIALAVSVLAQDPSDVPITEPTTAATTAEASVIATTTDAVASATASASAPPATSSAVDANDCLTADPFSTHDYFPNKLDLSKLGKNEYIKAHIPSS